MKKIIAFLLLLVVISSCGGDSRHIQRSDFDGENNRIKSKGVVYCDQYMIQIIEVDGHEYLSRPEGGFIHLESCNCKIR